METNKQTRDEILDSIVDYFEYNKELFTECVEALDSENGFLGDDKFYEMEALNEFYSSPLEAMQRAYYGHDGEVYSTDEHGETHYGEFCPMRDYFKFNGYGNLVSYDSKDYSDFLNRDTIETMSDNLGNISYAIEDDAELVELFDALDKADDENDDGEE